MRIALLKTLRRINSPRVIYFFLENMNLQSAMAVADVNVLDKQR